MKKITIYLAAVLFTALFTGCVKDTGNYVYQDPDQVSPIILSEFENSYSALMLEQFILNPEIRGNEADYDYYWVAYPAQSVTMGRRDTVSRERKLDYNVGLAPGTYKLVFQVQDKSTGVSDFQHTRMVVTSSLSKGYFINKYENGRTDIDFIDADGVLKPNILKTINGEDLPGRPIRSTISTRYSFPVYDGEGNEIRTSWQATFMICSDEDIRIYRGADLTQIYAGNGAFMEAPATLKPEGVWGTSSTFIMKNNGQMHSIMANIYSDGTFGFAYPREGMKLSDKVCAAGGNIVAFDENTGALVGYSSGSDRYAYITPYTGYEQYHFVNQELLCLETQFNYIGSTSHVFALLRSKNEGEVGKLRLVDVMGSSIGSVRQMAYYGSYEVPAEAANVGNGKVFCVQNGTGSGGGNSVLYYATSDNKVHYYNYNNQTHKSDVVSIPTDENLVYMYHKCDWALNGGSPALAYPGGYNSFLILSNKGGNWILREYGMEGATPDIDKAAGPKATYTGSGEAVNLICREPSTTRTF